MKGCPLVPKEIGLQLLREYEQGLERGVFAALKPAMVSPGSPGERLLTGALEMSPRSVEEARVWLASRVKEGRLARSDQIAWLACVFPEAPRDFVTRAAGWDSDPQQLSCEGVPWNRRKRRSILKARRGEVLLHLFSGKQRWCGPGFIVEVEKSRGADVLNDRVYQHLICWALRGVVGGVVGGPPCRTASQCRVEGDGGPPSVRDRGLGRWGLAGLTGHLQELVSEDSVLWMRFVLLYAVAQAQADEVVEVAGDGAELGSVEPEPQVVFPPEIRDPVALARWALRQAAEKLKRSSGQPDVKRMTVRLLRKLLWVWEHPADPATYRLASQAPKGGWASWWAFPEWREISKAYEIYEARFDQGALGHIRPKPSVVATTSWFLFEELHCRVLSTEDRLRFERLPSTVEERIKASQTWSCWAPGLSRLVQKAWAKWGFDQGLWHEVSVRRALLAKLSDQEMQERHEQHDHVPYRKGCPICVAAQGRQGSHWRSGHTGQFAASFDIAGPFVSGKSFDPVASGRDKGQGYRYFLACAYSVPCPPTFVPGVSGSTKGGDSPAPLVNMLPEEDEDMCMHEVEDLPSMEELFGPAERAVRFRARYKRPEAVDLDVTGVDDPREPAPLPPPCEPPPVLHRTVFLGVPLRCKKGKEVLGAVQSLLTKLEAYGFPVKRYHADRAQELKSKSLVAWLRDQAIHGTWTPGETPAGNKAELALQNLKALSRKLIAVAQLDPTFWPLAVLHASNRNWIEACTAMGVTQPNLLPFGLRLHARQRTRTGYQAHWRSRTVEGRYLGHAPNTPGGHLVLVGEGAEQKILLTNTVYPVGPEARVTVKPRYRLRVKTSPHFLLRSVPAVPVLRRIMASQGSRLSPGGEWVQVAFVSVDSESSAESDERSEDSACAHSLQPAVGIEHAEAGLQAKRASDVGGSEGGCSVMMPNETGGSSALRTTNDVMNVLWPFLNEPEQVSGSYEAKEWTGMFGLATSREGGVVSKQTRAAPEVVRSINGWIASLTEDFEWSTLLVLRNPARRLMSSWLRMFRGSVWAVRDIRTSSGWGLVGGRQFRRRPCGRSLRRWCGQGRQNVGILGSSSTV